jgi:hypothetical protein
MFYTRINKIKVFNNREGFLWLFNRRAEMRIYSYVTPLPRPLPTGDGRSAETIAAGGSTAGSPNAIAGGSADGFSPTLSDLANLPDDVARKQRLVEAVQSEAGKFAQSNAIEINGVKDNQSLTFGDAGMVIFHSESIPDALNIQLWMIESDEDIRNFALDADKILDSDAFKTLYATVETALVITNPVVSGVIAVGGVVVNLLRQKLRANKDDLVGYWVASLNRAEHYPHGLRDKQDVYDTTGNILVDYTLFGFEDNV